MAKQILEIKVGRDATGCYVSLRSDVSWDSIMAADSATFLLGGIPVHRFATQFSIPHLPFRVREGTEAKLFVNGDLNVSFLLAHGLRDGVIFRLSGPVSLEKMKLYTTQMRQLAKAVYCEHLKPVSMVCTLTVTEQEIL